MNIEYNDYILKQSTGDRFDLVQKVKKVKKDSDGVESTVEIEVDLGYSMQYESCWKRIILEDLKKNRKTVNAKQFLKEFKEEKEKLMQVIKLN